jgi:uncharacterized protein with FMN-binding domain
MRRALVATAGTVVGLVALLSYKASGPHPLQRVQVSGGQSSPAANAVPPSSTPVTTVPATTVPGSASGSGSTVPATTSPPAAAAGKRTYTGQDIQYVYGDIVVAVSLQGDKIVNVSVPQNNAIDGRSQMINSYAVPILEQETVAAQGVNINVVSGATFTSNAFAQSLQSALSQAHK